MERVLARGTPSRLRDGEPCSGGGRSVRRGSGLTASPRVGAYTGRGGRAWAREGIAEQIGDEQYDRYLCSNRTCELGMNLATGKDYRSVIFLLEELTRPETETA